MSSENIERAIGIEDHVEPAKQSLIGRRADEPAPAEAIEKERGNTHLVELFGPEFISAIDTARAVQQDDRGQLARRGTLRESQLASDRYGLAVLVAGSKIADP